MKKIKTIEKRVLENYLIHSPSKLPIETSFKNTHFVRREKLFLDCLKLPRQIFKNAELLDLGCGTGEHDILYAKWGAKLNLVEINNKSINDLKKYFQKCKLSKQIKSIKNQSLFDFKSSKKFDIAISEGVLHHTDNVEKGLKILTKNLKPGGFCILQLAFDTSHFQRSLQRLIIDSLIKDKNNLKEIEKISNKLFYTTINRAHRIGKRSKKQIIYDFYTNPKHKGVNLVDLLKKFKKNNIKYYSSYPSIEPENLINSLHAKVPNEQMAKNPYISLFQSLNFLIASSNDEKSIKFYKKELILAHKSWENLMKVSRLSDYEYGKKINFYNIKNTLSKFNSNIDKVLKKRSYLLNNEFKLFNKSLINLLKILKTKNIKAIQNCIKNSKILFNGYNGVPSNYIVGYKIK